MRQNPQYSKRHGAIIPLVAVSLIAVLGLVALAIDIGMVAVAKTQAQNAADIAAMVGTRTFDQNTGYNLSNVPKNAVKAAVANKIFDSYVSGDVNTIANPSADVYTSGAIKIEAGGYYYVYNDSNPASEGFQLFIGNKVSTEPYTAVRATITTTSPLFFGNVFGASPFNVKATAVAAHRPRDVVIVMDLSGSMNFQSRPGAYKSGSYMYPHFGPRNVSLNPESIFPEFGHYSDKTTAALQGTSDGTTGDEFVGRNNISSLWDPAGPCVIDGFMSSGSTKAFARSSDAYATAPGGDNYLKSGANYIKTITDYLGASPTPTANLNYERGTTGYGAASGGQKGYTEGPGYWGKTFFIWPPDPRGSDLDASDAANHANNGAKDWRQRFFFKENTSTGTLYWLDQNRLFFDSSGSPCTTDTSTTAIKRKPSTAVTVKENGVDVTYRYRINYAAIFHWLRNENPKPFPSTMTTGRIKYYDDIPNPTGDTGFNNRFWTQSPMTNLNERFWKDYVDFMLGFVETGANTYANRDSSGIPYTAYVGNGDLYAWGTVQVNQDKPDNDYKATVNNSGGYAAGHSGSMSFNNVQTLGGSAIDLPGPNPITGATNATPIVITSTNHGLTNGLFINITGVAGNTAANNSSASGKTTWRVEGVTTNTFQIKTTSNGNTTGSGSYTANTGAWVPAITAATNASPIVITTSAPHNIPSSGTFTVNITGVTGNTAANGKWTVTRVDANRFSLNGSTGNGAYITSETQWWEPVYYVRFGYGATFHELNPITISSGTLSATPDIPLTVAVANSSAVKIYTQVPKSMNYADNPYRPRHQFWFGAMSFLDWLGNYSIYYDASRYWLRWPGNVHEAQAWSCKMGISASIDDIKNNHPSDFVSLTFFSSPSYSTSGGGQHNMPVIPLGRNYQGLKDSLWFPPSTVSGGVTSITPYDPDFNNVPRSKGGTCPGMGLMLSYNLLSSSYTSLRTYATPTSTYRGYDGGLGRKGASRLVIFETDGAPNTQATASLTGTGADTYYPIRIKDPTKINNGSNEFPSSGSYSSTDVYNVVKQIVAKDTASPPGYSTTRKPAQVYSLGFGSLFEPSNSTTAKSDALDFLASVQYYGNVPGASTSGSSFPDWQRIYGDNTTRQQRLRDAITKIMQAGVQVSLIE